MNLRQIHEAYRQAVEAARNADSDEARIAAEADVIAKRHELDDALVAAEEARADEERIAAAESREQARDAVAGAAPVQKSDLPLDQIRAFARREISGIDTMLEFRADITNEVSATYAGYTVPESWASSVINFQIANSGLLMAGPTIINTAGGNPINMPTLVTDAASAAGAEGTAATQSNVVFGTTPLNAYRFDGFFSVSNELLADTGVDLVPLLRMYAGRSLAAKINPYFTDPDVGTGSDTIAAVQLGCTSAFSTTGYAVSDVGLDQLKQLYYSVLPQYRTNGKFVANSALTLATAQLKDDNGSFMWSPALSAAEPDRFMGKPWFEDAYMDSIATGNEPVIFGDIAAGYTIRYAHGGMQFIADKSFAVTSFETTFVWGVWVDAVATDVLAIKSITLG